MRLPRPGARAAEAPSGPGMPSQLGLDHPVRAEPSLGDFGALQLDTHAPPHRATPPPAPARGGAGPLLGGLALVVGFGAVGVLLAALWITGGPANRSAGETRPVAPPAREAPALPATPALHVDPPPAPVAPAEAQPAPQATAKPAAKASPAPKPKPKPAPPKPAPVAAPAAAVATLAVRGDAVVELQGEFGGFRAGTPLPPGSYQVWADFGAGLVDTGTAVEARAGDKIIATCNTSSQICSIVR